MIRSCSLHIGLNFVDAKHYYNNWDGRLYCCENDAVFMLDALTTNYLAEVVGAVIAAPGASPEKTMLQEALEKCSLVANGHRKTKSITALFDKAAAALPGLSSGSTFNALINTEKNIKDSGVQSLVKSDGSVIKNLLNQVQRLTI